MPASAAGGVPAALFAVDRRRRILQRVAEEQTIKIGELARDLNVSEMTIRRDIGRLERDGFLRHTHGGATAHITKSIELTFNARALEHAAEKRLIGMRAAEELAGPSVLFVGAGTTAEQFSLFLTPTPGLRVITGSLPVASLLGSRPVQVIALGGTVREEELACVGPIATATIARYRADAAVIGAAGVSAQCGITEFDDEIAEVNRAATAHCSRLVVLADASKIGTDAHAVVAPAEAISLLVTSPGAPEAELEGLRAAGVQTVIAGHGAGRQRSRRRAAPATPSPWPADRTDGGRRAPYRQQRTAGQSEEAGQ